MAHDLGILYFGRPEDNAKLQGQPVATYSLPAGHTCPGADECLAKFDRRIRKIVDGPQQKFRCFAASLEALRPSVEKSVDRNLAILKAARTTSRMMAAIEHALPPAKVENLRVHVNGDYYSEAYMLAWIETARAHPEKVFYGYTKSLPFWIKLRDLIPQNLVLNASVGGKFDYMIESNDLPTARVVFHPDEAADMGLEIDHDDSLARDPNVKHFALLIHGGQPAGTLAAAAVNRLRREKHKFSYSRAK